jgi:tRNA uridine 5-carbamoylmethylation protein Kti12
MRHELYDIARKNRCAFAVLHVSTPVELALEWNMNRENPVPNGVIEKIAERFDAPGSKYAWDRPIGTYNLGEDDFNNAGSEIGERLDTLRPIRGARHLSSKTPGDLLDVITRQVVKHFLDENPSMRNNPIVSKERRELLTVAKKQSFSPLETEQRLEAILGKMVSQEQEMNRK